MKIQNPTIGLVIILMAGMLLQTQAADYTWDGGGANSNWSTGANWVGDVAPGNGQSFFFSGTTGLTSNNDRTNYGIYGFTFNADAGAFTLTGNSFTLYAAITNNSAATQTLQLPIILANLQMFGTTSGDIVSKGGISGLYGIAKTGIKTLTLQGTNTYTGVTQIRAGTLVLDYTGGGSSSSSGITFGHTTGYNLLNTAILEVKGMASPSLGALSIYGNQSAKVILGAGVAATAASFAPAGGGYTSANIDLSAVGSSLTFTANPTLTNGIISRVTVTDAGGTGFATLNGNQIERLTSFTGSFTSAGGSFSTGNYTTSGVLNMGANAASANSLTITGGGSLTSTHVTGVRIFNGLLMQKDTSDFEIDGKLNNTGPLYLHQYSTAGTLILKGELQGGTANVLIKTGPGAVRIDSTSTSTYTGATYVQGGLLDVDGVMGATAVSVYDGASLSGGGTLGSTVLIRSGGELIASGSEALAINGALTLESDSILRFTLDGGGDHLTSGGAITLNSAINLVLTLTVAPTLGEEVTLLSGSSLSGGIARVNGQALGEDGTFQLSFDGTAYHYRLSSDSNQAWVQAVSVVPEPTTWILLGLGAMLLLRRKTAQ